MSEAIVLRTYPFQEADLVVSFLTRDQGKLRGVAKRARRLKSTFGSGLERLSHVKIAYFQSETRELVKLDSCELIHSQFGLVSEYEASVALDYFAEISEQLLPAAEPSELFFRLLLAVLDHLRSGAAGAVWRAATYFSLWAVRLSGFLADLDRCSGCGGAMDPAEPAWFRRGRSGLICSACKRVAGPGAGQELSAASRRIAGQMLRTPIGAMAQAGWSRETAFDLRRFLVEQIETHAEKRLITAPVLETL